MLAEVRMCEEKFLPVPVQISSRRDEEEVEEEEWEEPPETLEVDWTAISLMADQSDFSSPGVRR